VATSAAPDSGRALWADPLGSFGKVVGALAGLGVFLYLIGVVVMWTRLEAEDLQPQEVIAALPRDQIAVAGAREALLLAVSGAIFAGFLFIFYRLFRASERFAGTQGVAARVAHWLRERPAVFLTALIGTWAALVLPITPDGIVLGILFLTIVFVGIRSAHRSLIGESQDFRTSRVPWLRVAAGLSSSVLVVSIAHQREFPDRFSTATVFASGPRSICGLYLGASSDVIVLGQTPALFAPRGVCAGSVGAVREATTLLVARIQVKRLVLTSGPPDKIPASSLLRRIGVPLDCISPDCRIGTKRYGILEPFGRDSR
jgi:hypothetical protein